MGMMTVFGLSADELSLILGALFAASEAISLIPAVRANGVLQGIFGLIRFVAGRK